MKPSASAVILASVRAAVLFYLLGMLLEGIGKIWPPMGYLLRFVLFSFLTCLLIRRLAGSWKLTLTDCRILPFSLHTKGIMTAVLLPVLFFLVETGFSQGHWSIHQNPAAHVLGPVFRAIFYSGFCSGIVEEMMFRGYLAKLSEQRWGTKHALWLPSILFAFGHFRPGMNLLLFMFQFALYLCIGCFLTILTLQTGSVWNAVLVHSFWNLFVSGTSIVSVSSAPDSSALFTYVISAESPAAGLPQTMLLLFTCAILVFVSCILLLTGKNESA